MLRQYDLVAIPALDASNPDHYPSAIEAWRLHHSLHRRPSGGWARLKIGVVLGTNEPESAWNAFRFAVKALDSGHTVRLFLLGPGVECESIHHDAYDVPGQMQAFADRGGVLLACGTCLRSRQMKGSDLCPISTMQDLVDLTTWADRALTF